ncbi:hypothetical protein P7H21_00045 [Paenibacillus larvae]|nr:hypothetical protein [Paenibacillus larvae]MDT2302750.1 hypothetical protein [Paenibacillus larvae]
MDVLYYFVTVTLQKSDDSWKSALKQLNMLMSVHRKLNMTEEERKQEEAARTRKQVAYHYLF